MLQGTAAQSFVSSDLKNKNGDQQRTSDLGILKTTNKDGKLRTATDELTLLIDSQVVAIAVGLLNSRRFSIPGSIGIVTKQPSRSKALNIAFKKLNKKFGRKNPYGRDDIKIVKEGSLFFALILLKKGFK